MCGLVVLMNIFLLQWLLSDIAYVCYYPHFIDEKTKALTGPITQKASGLAWRVTEEVTTAEGLESKVQPSERDWGGAEVGMGLRNEPRRGSRNVCVCVRSAASVPCDSLRPCGRQPARLLCPWDSPGKNTGVTFPSPGNLPNPGIEATSPALAGGFFTISTIWEASLWVG